MQWTALDLWQRTVLVFHPTTKVLLEIRDKAFRNFAVVVRNRTEQPGV